MAPETLGLRLLEVCDPHRPQGAGHMAQPSAEDVETAGTTAYLVADDRLHVVDIVAPHHPMAHGFLPLPGKRNRIAVAGNDVYVASGGRDCGSSTRAIRPIPGKWATS